MSDGTARPKPKLVVRAHLTVVIPSVNSSKESRVQHSSLSTPPVSDFSGLWIPLVTPFRDGAVDHAALTRLVERLAPTGIAGFVVCGSTGEAAALEENEQLAVLATVAQAAPTVPRIMGISGYHLRKTLEWVRRLSEHEAAGLLVPAPSYIRPSQNGLVEWFSAISDASAAPLVIYDIPYRTGVSISRDTLLTIAAHPRIRAIKDCGGDGAKTRALIADGRLQVLAGEDGQIFSTVAEGGAGAIAASAHLQTERFVNVIRLLREGKLAQARKLWHPLLPLIEALFADANPGPLKAVLANEGVLLNELRSPMTRAPAVAGERLLQIQAALNRR